MKLKQWLYGATALAMLAACSERDIAPGGDNPNNGVNQSTKDASYLGVSIELPSESETRAGDDEGPQGNDNFDDGLKVEYKVNTAAMLLFQGATESSAKFVGAYELNTDNKFDQPNYDNITVSFQKTIKVLEEPVLGTSEKLWGLAIVNYSEDIFSINSETDDVEGYGDLTIATVSGNKSLVKLADVGSSVTTGEGESATTTTITANDVTTFSEFRQYVTNSHFLRYDNSGKFAGIFMTNAPLCNVKGTTVKPASGFIIRTLSELQPKFKKTQEEAIQDPAGCIFVERAVAKVTCSGFPDKITIRKVDIRIPDDGSGTPVYNTEDYDLGIKNVEWMIDNEERTSYIVRNAQKGTDFPFWDYVTDGLKGSPRYRFIGNQGMDDYLYDDNSVHDNSASASTWYRTYWCIDPVYNEDRVKGAGNNAYNDQATNASATDYKGLKDAQGEVIPFYPRENTFDVQRQKYKNTTRVIFKVTYDSDAGIYAVRDQLGTMYLQKDAENLLAKEVLGSSDLHDMIVENADPDKVKAANIAAGVTDAELQKQIKYNINDFNFVCGPATADNTDKKIKKGDYVITTLSFKQSFITKYFKGTFSATDDNVLATFNAIKLSASSANHIVPFNNNEAGDNIAYYAVYIQHFGDTYCPLPKNDDGSDKWSGTTIDDVYADGLEASSGLTVNDVKYLGRYGMVRNNWYDIVVNSISRLGNATVPNGFADTSDDNKLDEWYLSARVHVLSWAKRTQHTDL